MRIKICCPDMSEIGNGEWHTIKYFERNQSFGVMGCDCEAIENIKYCPYCSKELELE